MSIVIYATWVSEGCQQPCNFKDDGNNKLAKAGREQA
jgi:hypothetical protein